MGRLRRAFSQWKQIPKLGYAKVNASPDPQPNNERWNEVLPSDDVSNGRAAEITCQKKRSEN
jgi:hypothetical protein